MDINSYVKNGEKLLWKGQASPTATLNKTYKKRLTSLVVIIVCVLAVLLALFMMMAKHQNVPMNWVFFCLVAVLAFLPVINLFSDAGKVSKAVYIATDKRLIAVTDGEKTISYDRVTEAAFRTDDDGLTTFLCGTKAVGSRPYTWRDRTCRGNQSTKEEEAANKPCESFAFYAVNDPEGLKAVLKDRLSCPVK